MLSLGICCSLLAGPPISEVFVPTFFCTSVSTVFHNNPFWPQQLPGARPQQASIFRSSDVGSVLPRAVLLLTADCLGLALASWVGSKCAPVFSQFSSITDYLRLSQLVLFCKHHLLKQARSAWSHCEWAQFIGVSRGTNSTWHLYIMKKRGYLLRLILANRTNHTRLKTSDIHFWQNFSLVSA